MRDRLLAAFVGLTIAVIALYGVPRAFILADLVEDERQRDLAHAAEYVSATLDAVLRAGAPVTDEVLSRALEEGQRIEYASADGAVRVRPAGTAREPGDPAATRPLAQGGSVTISLDDQVVAGEVRRALWPLLVLGVVLVAVSAATALLLARRLSRPFTELAALARAMGTGTLTPDIPHYRIPEAEIIGRALADSGERLETMVRREREVAVHASHELRTPITALRLTLEDLALWPETAPEIAEELHRIVAEVDRFSVAVTDLLEEAGTGRMQESEEVDLRDVVSDAVERWRSVASAVGLDLEAGPCAPAVAHLPRGAVVQAVDLALQHACEVAADTIRVGCADRGSHLAVEVAFAQRLAHWQGAPAATAKREAAEAAAALGGWLGVEPPREGSEEPVLVLLLPSAEASRTVR